jgi:hypothetical protein
MCVRLPSGIVCCTTACCKISCACALISCGVSNAIPFGGAENPGSVGLTEWQTAHRCATMACATANGTCAVDVLGGWADDGLIQIATPASASAAVTGIHQSVRPR